MNDARPLAILALALLAGCAPIQSPYFDTVTILSAGEVTNGLSTFGLQSILLRGNFGVIWMGTNPVAICTNRFVTQSPAMFGEMERRDARAAAGWITFFENDRSYDIGETDRAVLERTLDWKRVAPGRIEAIRVTAALSMLDSSEAGKTEGGRRGILLGFFAPAYLEGLQPARYRWWFLDDQGPRLYTVNDFDIAAGRVEVDECGDLQVRLPPTAPAMGQ